MALSTCSMSSVTPISAHICWSAVAMPISSTLPARTRQEKRKPLSNPASFMQRLGLGGIGREDGAAAGVERRRARHEARHRRADAVGHDGDDGVLVGGVVQRLAHLDVGERVVGAALQLGPDVEVAVGHLGGGEQLHVELGVGLELLDAAEGHEFGAVEFARLHLEHAGRVVGQDLEGDAVEVGQRLAVRALAPVVRVLDELHLLAPAPGHEGEGAGADGVFGEGLGLVVQRRARHGLDELLAA